jgi:hypothetical protein
MSFSCIRKNIESILAHKNRLVIKVPYLGTNGPKKGAIFRQEGRETFSLLILKIGDQRKSIRIGRCLRISPDEGKMFSDRFGRNDAFSDRVRLVFKDFSYKGGFNL